MGLVSLQPELSVGWKGLSLSAWGSVGLSDKDDARELGLTLSYETGGLSFGIVDYWDDSGKRAFSSYFELSAPFRLATCDWEARFGLVPWKSGTYDVSGFSVTNLCTARFQWTRKLIFDFIFLKLDIITIFFQFWFAKVVIFADFSK